jgi:hypothetical protein
MTIAMLIPTMSLMAATSKPPRLNSVEIDPKPDLGFRTFQDCPQDLPAATVQTDAAGSVWRKLMAALGRREVLSVLGGAAAVYSLTAYTQQPARMSRIGWIAIGTPQGSEFLEAVREGLRQLD